MKLRTALLALLIPLIVLLAYLLMEYVQRYILAPAIYAFRVEKILYEAFPQYLWWGIFLLILIVITGRVLIRSLVFVEPSTDVPEDQRSSRAEIWSRWIEASQHGSYSRWWLARHLAKLTVDIISHQERGSPEQIRADILAGIIEVPPEIQDYLKVGLESPSFRHYSDLLARFQSRTSISPLNLDPRIMVEFLETRIQAGGST